MREAVKRPQAKADLMDIADTIAERAGFDVSERFLKATDDAFRILALMPGMGAQRDCGNSSLAGLRMWPIPRFTNYLIFYLSSEEEIEIVRVLHAARDIQAIFEVE